MSDEMGSGKVMEHACLSLVTHILILVSLPFSKLHRALCCAHNIPFVVMVAYMCIKFNFFTLSVYGDISGGVELLAHVEVREQIYRVNSLLPPLHGFWELNLGCQTCM